MDKQQTNTTYDVFISYAHTSIKWVEDELIPKLQANNITYWWDKEQIPVLTNDWRVAIDEAIDKCRMMMVVMTPDANDSNYVTFEWSYALGMKKRLLLCLREETNNIHPRLMTKQFVEMTDKSYDWDELLAVIRKTLEQSPIVMVSQDKLIEALTELMLDNKLEQQNLHLFKRLKLIGREDQRRILAKVQQLQQFDK